MAEQTVSRHFHAYHAGQYRSGVQSDSHLKREEKKKKKRLKNDDEPTMWWTGCVSSFETRRVFGKRENPREILQLRYPSATALDFSNFSPTIDRTIIDNSHEFTSRFSDFADKPLFSSAEKKNRRPRWQQGVVKKKKNTFQIFFFVSLFNIIYLPTSRFFIITN